MKNQRVMSQMKEQDKTPEKQLNETEVGSLPEKSPESWLWGWPRTWGERWRRCRKRSPKTTKDQGASRGEQCTGRGQQQNNWGRKWVNDLEDRMVAITATEQNIEKRTERNEDSLRDLRDIKRTNTRTTGTPEGEQKGPERYLKR